MIMINNGLRRFRRQERLEFRINHVSNMRRLILFPAFLVGLNPVRFVTQGALYHFRLESALLSSRRSVHTAGRTIGYVR